MKTKKNMIEQLIDEIANYGVIINDYINKDFVYTYESEYLEEEIKVIMLCLLETIEELKSLLY